MLNIIALSGGLTINQLSTILKSSRSWADKLVKNYLTNGLIHKCAIMTGNGKGRETTIYTISKIGAREAGSNWTPYRTANAITKCYLRAGYLAKLNKIPSSITFFEKQVGYQLDGAMWPFKVDNGGKVGGRDCIVTDDGYLAWPLLFDGEEKGLAETVNIIINSNKNCSIICRKMDESRITKLLESKLNNQSNKSTTSIYNVPRSRREWINYHTQNKDNIVFQKEHESEVKSMISKLPKNDDTIKKAIINNSLPCNIKIVPINVGRVRLI